MGIGVAAVRMMMGGGMLARGSMCPLGVSDRDCTFSSVEHSREREAAEPHLSVYNCSTVLDSREDAGVSLGLVNRRFHTLSDQCHL